jgi:hypothetical protein
MKKFTYKSIRDEDYDGKKYWLFECGMISTCSPLFDSLEDNYGVEKILRSRKVISPKTKTDTESCALVIQFSTKKAGEKFIDRLNAYLEKVKAFQEMPCQRLP